MLTTQTSTNLPLDLRVEGELVDVKARNVARRSGVFHSVPRREKVLSLDTHEVISPFGFVSQNFVVTNHQSFSARFYDSVRNNRRLIAVSDNAALRSQHDLIPVSVGKLHSLKPVSAGVRKIKGDEAAGLGEQPMTNGVHRLDVFATTAPDFTVKRNAARKLTSEAGRSFDDVTIASPELVAVPKSATAIKLFTPEISSAVPEIPVSGKSHVCLVHNQTLNQSTDHCLVRFITERQSMSYAR